MMRGREGGREGKRKKSSAKGRSNPGRGRAGGQTGCAIMVVIAQVRGGRADGRMGGWAGAQVAVGVFIYFCKLLPYVIVVVDNVCPRIINHLR